MIYDQLKEQCDCIKDGITESDIDELVGLISMLTCWTQKPCETFLNGDREQVIPLPECLCDCDVFEFEPFYTPFDPESFEFTLVEQTGIEETLTPITNYKYSEVDRKFKMVLPIPDCKCKPDCGCPTKYKLIVRYVAGYEDIPECLIPVFCEALQYILDRKKCDCSECQECTNKYDEATDMNYASGSITGQLKIYFVQTLANQYRRQLSLISLCGKGDCDIWGFRV